MPAGTSSYKCLCTLYVSHDDSYAGVTYWRAATPIFKHEYVNPVWSSVLWLEPFSHRALMRSCLRDTEKTAVDNCVKVQAALIQLSAKKAFIFTKKVKRKEKKKRFSWECCWLSSSALITGCSSGPKPKPCFCIWEDVWSLSRCAGTCMTRLSYFFVFPVFRLSFCLMSEKHCRLRVRVLLTCYPRNSRPQSLIFIKMLFESLSRSFLLFLVKKKTWQ